MFVQRLPVVRGLEICNSIEKQEGIVKRQGILVLDLLLFEDNGQPGSIPRLEPYRRVIANPGLFERKGTIHENPECLSNHLAGPVFWDSGRSFSGIGYCLCIQPKLEGEDS